MDQLWFVLFLLKATFSVQAITPKECMEFVTEKYNQMPPECTMLSVCTLDLNDPSIDYTCFSIDNSIYRPCNRRESFGTYVQASCRPPYFYNESHPMQKTGMTCLLNGEWGNDLEVPEFKCGTAEKFLEKLEEFRVGVKIYRYMLNLPPDRKNVTQQDILSKNLSCAKPNIYYGKLWAWNEGNWKEPTQDSYQQIAFKVQCDDGYQLPVGVPSIYYCSKDMWTSPLKSDICKRACNLREATKWHQCSLCINDDLKVRICRNYEPVGTKMIKACLKGYHVYPGEPKKQIRICIKHYSERWWEMQQRALECYKN